MNLFQAAFLGVIEGLTEFLPVSSTGHLILASYALKIPETEFLKSFQIAIQLGAICAVLALYWRSFLNIEILKRVMAAFVPTAIIGFALYSFIKKYLIGNEYIVLISLVLGGIVLIAFDRFHKENGSGSEDIKKMTYRQAVYVGFFQTISIIPGVSRSAATIIGGLAIGLRRAVIVEFSFLLAVPTMAAATGLDLLKSYSSFSGTDTLPLALGFAMAFIVALAVMRLFLSIIRKGTFSMFGAYRIILAAIFWLIIL